MIIFRKSYGRHLEVNVEMTLHALIAHLNYLCKKYNTPDTDYSQSSTYIINIVVYIRI